MNRELDVLPEVWFEGDHWDATHFEVACVLHSCANSGWTGYTHERARADLDAHACRDEAWGAAKVEEKWLSAESAVRRTGVGPPSSPEDGFGGEPLPEGTAPPQPSGVVLSRFPRMSMATLLDAGDKRHARQVRLVVRRVRPTPGSQLALCTAWDYHAFVTDRNLPLAEVEADHRRHAVVEQAIAELKSAGPKHLPSGHFGQRCLARVGRHGPQPRPSRRSARRPRPTTSLPLAMGRRDHHRARPHPRPPAALLNNDRRDDQDLGNAGRPARSACPQPDQVATRGPIAAVTSDAKITGGSGVRR